MTSFVGVLPVLLVTAIMCMFLYACIHDCRRDKQRDDPQTECRRPSAFLYDERRAPAVEI